MTVAGPHHGWIHVFSNFWSNFTNLLLQKQVEKAKTNTDPDKRAMQERQIAVLTKALESMEAAVKAGDGAKLEESKTDLLSAAKDLLSEWLDREKGGEVRENVIFSKLPRYWEEKYHQDMEALNVSRTRPMIPYSNPHTTGSEDLLVSLDYEKLWKTDGQHMWI